ncbi:hypothetical protein B0H63DRAFT_525901 [Podospora didyma]|uniref:Nephrocystin 3-like N-terminal domain-containing protein n=1 Tax=Podospora didyma TaxID=330526 RepID=A0AAE0KER4_9PEZI|nr:hypothetical protein B0H63DRAFT_525901 [Podospora didyma]
MDPIGVFPGNVLRVVEAAITTGKTLKDLYKSSIAQECTDVIKCIREILEECKLRKKSSIHAAGSALFTAAKHKSDLQKLQDRLESKSGQLRTAMAAATRVDPHRIKDQLGKSDRRQSNIFNTLEGINQSLLSQKSMSDLRKNLEALLDATNDAYVVAVHESILQGIRPAAANTRFDQEELYGLNLEDKVLPFSPHVEDESFEQSSAGQDEADAGFSDSPSLWSGPFSSPPDPESASFFQEPALLFQNRLRSGSGVFHFTGKPGSEKSALMKFLFLQEATKDLLLEWATSSGKQLVVSRFFFWKLGVEDRKTIRGLLRGLLYDICTRAQPSPNCPSRSCGRLALRGKLGTSMAFTLDDSTYPMSRLLPPLIGFISTPDILQRFCVCLFIDGLDEFDEKDKSHWLLAKRLKAWTASSPIKLCVSSREYESIMQEFPASQRLTLHELTTRDIKSLVYSRLRGNQFFEILYPKEPDNGEALLCDIIRNAQGVFLWVILLLRWLEEELSSGHATIASLRSISQEYPSKLDEFIQRITPEDITPWSMLSLNRLQPSPLTSFAVTAGWTSFPEWKLRKADAISAIDEPSQWKFMAIWAIVFISVDLDDSSSAQCRNELA